MPSQALIRQFKSRPEHVMRSHVVRWSGDAPEDSRIIRVALLDSETSGNARAEWKAGPLKVKVDAKRFELRWEGSRFNPPRAGSDLFSVYWSGFRASSGCSILLPPSGGPDMMLTPEFSGCAAAFSKGPDGSTLFSHYNLKDGSRTLDRPGMMAAATLEHGKGVFLLSKEQMRQVGKRSMLETSPTAVLATIVGTRNDRRWTFWVQYREIDGDTQHIRSVEQMQNRSTGHLDVDSS
ncbi:MULTISPECIES: hypothetical protein [Stenotrophomonas]|uniref:Uncharacterized protein n=1 Tax=Stenotrophomonas maltophilia TaxID=40324 RepID=A0AAI9FWA6_STEMA|nr:hypothetical protein [Stenotrophomonas maltophilia]UUS15214.1 hypothetical protein NMB32_04745 [Stenotrophomonas sp. CD2]AWT16767.1 hypothetical protein DM611_21980 [Stenotrophomonas maltophilia]EKT4094122.1 hypothetical protein [Stenotrophomonas maltophilia]MBA0361502.1 hypothetical protein [Stenotrophomonas maltophilia]HEL5043985.1 hypothetical protein [Stenotrophomonas maltophilia]